MALPRCEFRFQACAVKAAATNWSQQQDGEETKMAIALIVLGTLIVLASPWWHKAVPHPMFRAGDGGEPGPAVFWVQLGLTIVVGGICLYVLFFGNYSADQQKWAAGFLGTILGFWFGKAGS
jgi:hypothetical protein